MKLSDLNLDAIFCLNLDRRTDRKDNAVRQFNYLGLDPIFYRAIDMSKFNVLIDGYYKPGMIGCYASHLAILQHCILNKYSRVLITEDDLSVIVGGNSLLAEALPQLPTDWNFAYLGYTVFPEYRKKSVKINDYWCVPGGCWGTQAYMINGADTIQYLFDRLQTPKLQVDLDLAFNVLPNSGLKYYAITPSAIKQLKGRSDVQ